MLHRRQTPVFDATFLCPAVCDHQFQDLCTAAGVRVEYLPPYTPDFNPIEKSFAGLKAWMQKNRDLVAAFGAGFIRWGLVRICSCAVCLALGMLNHVTTR